MPTSRYTLVVPTFNRPEELGRLLRFLAYQGAAFPVLLLDSSRADVKQRNATLAAGLSLDLRIESYDSDTPPWEKFWRGLELVNTEYASLCADDDLLLANSIAPLTDFLDAHSDYSLAHGWYFSFYLTAALGLTGVVYRGPSIDSADPLERLHQLFARYEALTYGVHRTSVLQKALARVQGLESMLGRELLGGAITVAYGKAARLPLLYIGRSLGPSESYRDWHPTEFLLSSPQSLFEEYARYRRLLLECLAEGGAASDARALQLVDLAHLRYLSEYISPAALDYLIEHVRAGTSRSKVVGGLWPMLVAKGGIEGALHRSRILRLIRDRFFPWVRGHHVRKAIGTAGYASLFATTASGARRRFEVYEAFRKALSELPGSRKPESLTSILRGYE